MIKTIYFTPDEVHALGLIAKHGSESAGIIFDAAALWGPWSLLVTGQFVKPLDPTAPCFTAMNKLIEAGLANQLPNGHYSISDAVHDIQDPLVFTNNPSALTLTCDGKEKRITSIEITRP